MQLLFVERKGDQSFALGHTFAKLSEARDCIRLKDGDPYLILKKCRICPPGDTAIECYRAFPSDQATVGEPIAQADYFVVAVQDVGKALAALYGRQYPAPNIEILEP